MLRASKSLMMGEIDVPGTIVVPDVGVDKLVLDQGVQVVEAVFGSRDDRHRRVETQGEQSFSHTRRDLILAGHHPLLTGRLVEDLSRTAGHLAPGALEELCESAGAWGGVARLRVPDPGIGAATDLGRLSVDERRKRCSINAGDGLGLQQRLAVALVR